MKDIRGDWHDLLIIDEYGNIAYKNQALAAALWSLKDKTPLNQLFVVGTSDVTVDLGRRFTKLFDAGQGQNPEIKSWQLRGEDNPYTDKTAINVAKDIATTDDILREEEGEDIPATGKLFPHFDYKLQVCPQTWKKDMDYMIDIDFGYRKPIVEAWQYDIPNIRFLDEIGELDITIIDLIPLIQEMIDEKFEGFAPAFIACDPAGKAINSQTSLSDFKILKSAFPQAVYTTKTQLRHKGNQVRLWRLLTRKRLIWVDPKCRKLASAIALATPDISLRTGAFSSAGWKKEHGLDDPLDAASYGFINFKPLANMIIPKREKKFLTPEQAHVINMNMG
jgi:hypothetical protein